MLLLLLMGDCSGWINVLEDLFWRESELDDGLLDFMRVFVHGFFVTLMFLFWRILDCLDCRLCTVFLIKRTIIKVQAVESSQIAGTTRRARFHRLRNKLSHIMTSHFAT